MVGLSQGDGRPCASPALLSALILGGADTLADDEARARELFTPDILVACNHAGRDRDGPLDHWATMHPDLMAKLWLPERRRAGRPDPKCFWRPRHRPSPAEFESEVVESWGGSSGLLCVAVAVQLGCTRIVLAGVPMLPNNAHYDDPRRWSEARAYHRSWEVRKSLLLTKVKSMSGWTRDLLGAPDAAWCAGSPEPCSSVALGASPSDNSPARNSRLGRESDPRSFR